VKSADELVEIYGTAVYRFCLSLTFCKEDAEDLFQDTFVQAFSNAQKMGENPQSFLFSTAVYLWKSRKRKFARRSKIAPPAALDDFAKSDFDTEADFLTREEARLVRQFVAELPNKLRLPVIMFYSAQLNISEIAAALKIPEGTVKSRLHKARKLIEKGLTQNG
jgi:RNA polymerase sigma-70 factor (ECF subfamily)